jgi:drug/metabolite transporter (DMT)-like permease
MTAVGAASTVQAGEKRQRTLGYAALAVSTIGVGSALIFVRLSQVDPTATLMLRMTAAGVMVGAATVSSGQVTSWSAVSFRDLGLVVISSIVSGADLLANQWSVIYTSVASTALLINLSPVFVLLLSWLVLRKRTSLSRLAALALAIAGAGLVVKGGGESPSLPPNHLLGDGLAVLSAFLYAVYLLMTKNLRSRTPTSLLMFGNAVVIAVMLLPVALATSSPVLPPGLEGYLIVLGYALVSQLLGHGMMAYALRTVDTGLASLSALLRPVVAMVLGWLILAEAVGALQLAGAAVVLAGLAWFTVVDLQLLAARGARARPG